jgi:hypothetical protein
VAQIGFGGALLGLDLPLRFETARVEEEGFNNRRKKKVHVGGLSFSFVFLFSFFI